MNDNRKRRELPTHYSLSVIVPAFDEVENIEPLALEFDDFLSEQKFRAEVIVVDDGSTDGTAEKVLDLSKKYGFLKLVRHKQNMGKTAAIESGFAVSKGKRISIFDADLQYDVRDIKRMMDKLDKGFGIVSGIKKGKYQKPLVSKIYNALTSKLFGVKVQDMNSLKLLRRDVMAGMFLRKDWHRFMVVLAAEQGHRIAEIPVTLRPRLHGEPKYSGIGRVFIGLTDLVAVWLAERIFRKPMLIFGSFGFVTLGLGVLLGLAILLLRLIWGWGYPPLQTILIILVSLGGLSLTLGFLAEAIANLRDRMEFLISRASEHVIPKVETAHTRQPQKSHPHDRARKDNRKSGDESISRYRENKQIQADISIKPEKAPDSKVDTVVRTPVRVETKPDDRPQEKKEPRRRRRPIEKPEKQTEKAPGKPDIDTPKTPVKAEVKPEKQPLEKQESKHHRRPPGKPERQPETGFKKSPEKSDAEKQNKKSGPEKRTSTRRKPPREKAPENEPAKKPEEQKKEPTPTAEEEVDRHPKLIIIPYAAEPSWGKRKRKGRSNIPNVTDDKEAIERAEQIAKHLDDTAYVGYEKKEMENDNDTKS